MDLVGRRKFLIASGALISYTVPQSLLLRADQVID